MNISIAFCYLMLFFVICVLIKNPTGHIYVRSFFAHFSTKEHLIILFLSLISYKNGHARV